LRIGVIGHDGALAAAALAAGLEVVAVRGAGAPADSLLVPDHAGFREAIEDPRIFLLDLAPGAEIDAVIDDVYVHMEPGDLVIDPSGSYWGDTLRRWRRMRHRSLYYVDAAILPTGNGRRILFAGEPRGCAIARPALELLAAGGPVVEAGEPGAAHFALMVEEAYHATVARARSEAQQLLEAFPSPLRVHTLLAALPGGEVAEAPRAAWLLEDAVQLQAATPLLAQAVMEEIAEGLEDQRPPRQLPRLGPFVHPDELL
jgi:6-phosphogluconate dehydrogenase